MKEFRIIGRKYSTEKSYYPWDAAHKWFRYEQIAEHEFPPKKFESLAHAEMWLLENFPEYYFGANISAIGECAFSMIATPCFYEMEFKTNNREYILAKVKEEIEECIKKGL